MDPKHWTEDKDPVKRQYTDTRAHVHRLFFSLVSSPPSSPDMGYRVPLDPAVEFYATRKVYG